MNKEELKKKIEELGDSNPEETLRLSGCLIRILKQDVANATNKLQKDVLRYELVQCLEKHKVYIENVKKGNTKILLPKKVGLKVNEIATTIEIFKEKKDIIQKAKNVVVNTGVSAVVIAGITSAFALVGGTFSLATLATLAPSVCYIGLSNILREGVKETDFSKKVNVIENQEKIIEEARQFALDNIVNNKEFIDLLLKKKNSEDLSEKIEVDRLLIKQYKLIRDKSPNNEIRNALSVELINLQKELKKNLEKMKKLYIKDKVQLTNIEFAALEKEIMGLSVDMFKEENFLFDASKNALQNIKVNTVTMFVSKLLLSGVFPSLAFDEISDFITPLFHIVVNNITNMGDFKDKINMANTNYVYRQIKFHNPELFKKIIEKKGLAMA